MSVHQQTLPKFAARVTSTRWVRETHSFVHLYHFPLAKVDNCKASFRVPKQSCTKMQLSGYFKQLPTMIHIQYIFEQYTREKKPLRMHDWSASSAKPNRMEEIKYSLRIRFVWNLSNLDCRQIIKCTVVNDYKQNKTVLLAQCHTLYYFVHSL